MPSATSQGNRDGNGNGNRQSDVIRAIAEQSNESSQPLDVMARNLGVPLQSLCQLAYDPGVHSGLRALLQSPHFRDAATRLQTWECGLLFFIPGSEGGSEGGSEMIMEEADLTLGRFDPGLLLTILRGALQVVQEFESVEQRRLALGIDNLGGRVMRAEVYMWLWRWCRYNEI